LKDLSFLVQSAAPDKMLTAPWTKPNDQVLWFSKSAWALAAICQAWMHKNTGQTPVLWIPSYFCNQSLWPARQTGAKVHFYPVTAEMEPDWQRLMGLAQKQKPDLFLLTHFFGQQNPPIPARQFCDQFGSLLVEDGAHVLRPFDEIGEWADMTFYSLHKLLPIPDGSLLVVRPRAAEYLPALQQARAQWGGKSASPWRWLGKRWVQKFIPTSVGRSREKKNPVRFDDNSESGSMPTFTAPSDLTPALVTRQVPDLDLIAKARIENESHFRRLFARNSDLQAWPNTASHPERVPYYAIFRCPSAGVAESYYKIFRQQGLIVLTWPDMAPEVLSSPEEFSEALRLRSTLLAFPVHQSLKESDIGLYHLRISTNGNAL
jgi:hypothetical protein